MLDLERLMMVHDDRAERLLREVDRVDRLARGVTVGWPTDGIAATLRDALHSSPAQIALATQNLGASAPLAGISLGRQLYEEVERLTAASAPPRASRLFEQGIGSIAAGLASDIGPVTDRFAFEINPITDCLASCIGPIAERLASVRTIDPISESCRAAGLARSYIRPADSITRILADLALDRSSLAQARFQSSELAKALASIRSPWMAIDAEFRSAKAFADMMGIGRLLTESDPFATAVGETLRPSLGDWRHSPERDPSALLEPDMRLRHYSERGVDPSLADFPLPAFIESVSIAGLFDENHLDPERTEFDEELSASAFRLIARTERRLRFVIEAVLRAAFGNDWVEAVLTSEMQRNWRRAGEAATTAGRPTEATAAYAAFDDYRKIIERDDLWPLFEQVFVRKQDISESLFRLSPVRLATMHSRIITKDDLLLLYVEGKRIGRAYRTFRSRLG